MNKNRILIADDSAINREMLSCILGEKYDFEYAADGEEVIEKIRGKNDIDLILLDITMPKMDGFEVLRIMNERHFIEDFPVIIISASDSADFVNQGYQLGAVDYICRPFNTIVVQRRVENTLLMYSNQKRLHQLVVKQVYDKERRNNSMITLLSNIVESRNQELGSHTLNVQLGTELLLKQLVKITDKYNLSKNDIVRISSLAALHDIGKIKVPEEILNKPGKLTPEEWQIMKNHTIEGEKILRNAMTDQDNEFLHDACEICRWHHEKYDGKGYPDGLKGDEIPIAAQVVSLADVYDALTGDRCYKKAFNHEVAVEMILTGECGIFNPLLLECLKRIDGNLKSIKEEGIAYDSNEAASYLVDEVFTENTLPVNNGLRRMMDNERMKKEFFMECTSEIKFEYDKVLNRITFTYDNCSDNGEEIIHRAVFKSKDSKVNILPLAYWDLLTEKIKKTTRENSTVSMDVELSIEGKNIPYHAKLKAIWPEDGSDYISVLGHFTKI